MNKDVAMVCAVCVKTKLSEKIHLEISELSTKFSKYQQQRDLVNTGIYLHPLPQIHGNLVNIYDLYH